MTQTPLSQRRPPQAATTPRTALWIGGRWRQPRGDGTLAVTDPATEQILAHVPLATAVDVEEAVAAAAAAFPAWAGASVADRLRPLRRLVELLDRNADEFADVLTAETGMPRSLTGGVQLPFAREALASTVDIAETYPWQERIGHSLVRQEALGVVACITPWNAPLALLAQKLAPALAAGCTVVVKPSELAPLNTYLLFDMLAECDFPPGVVNLVCGTGPMAGEALAAHPGVAAVSLTGSLRAGRRVAALAADRAAKVALELGGKSASLVLDDADLATAVTATVDQVMFNSGQACFAWSRLLVPAARYAEAAELAAGAAAPLAVGDPWDPATRLGPLITAAARDRVVGMIARGRADGARVLCGGDEAAGQSVGFYVSPTVMADVPPDSELARQEVFGPVLTLLPYRDDEDAVRLANATDYGLHGAVWSGDPARALAVAERLRTGRVDINGAPFNLRAPFGGYKKSGNGRELGRWGLDSFCETKSIQLPQDVVDGGDALLIRSQV